LLALLFSWLWVIPMSTLPFQGGKAWALTGFGALALAAAATGRGLRAPSGHVRFFLLAGTLIIIGSTLVSVAPRVALWGNDDRHMGVAVWLAAGVLGYTWWAGQGDPRSLGRVLSLSSYLTGGILLWTRFFAPPSETLLGTLAPGLQVGGPLGNESFLGVAMAASMPYFVGLAWASYREGRASRHWWIAALWSALLPLVVGSRAAILGLWAALLVLGWLFLHARVRRDRRPCLALGWWGSGLGLPAGSLVWALTHPHGRLWNLLERNGTLAQRLLVWQADLQLLLRHPLRAFTGFGADAMGVVFPQVYPAALTDYEPDMQAHVFDRAHNLFLDIWIQFGIGGVVLLVLGGAMLVRHTWPHVRSGDNPVMAGALSSWLSLMLMWQFHFPTPTTLLMVALFATTSIGPTSRSGRSNLPYTLTGIALALIVQMALPYGGTWSRSFLLEIAMLLYALSRSHGSVGPLYVLFLPSLLVASLWLLTPTRWVFVPALTVWSVALLIWGWERCRQVKPVPGRRTSLIWASAILVLAYVAVRPLIADGFHQAARLWAGSREKGNIAERYGKWAWRLDPRERVALTMAQLALGDKSMPSPRQIRAARAWLTRSPQPHSASWWYVDLQLMDIGVRVGVFTDKERRRAYRAALAYFPGNVRWRMREP